MTRPKGSKNKVKQEIPTMLKPFVDMVIPKPLMEMGNPDFNLQAPEVLAHMEKVRMKEAELGQARIDQVRAENAFSAITEEDLALDMELDRMAMEEPIPDMEPSLEKPLTKEKVSMDHLREHLAEEYSPARTLNELEQQVMIAKRLGCDSVDAEDKIIYHYCGANYKRSLGFFMYKDIKVHFTKEYESTKARLKQTIEQQMFGNSKVK